MKIEITEKQIKDSIDVVLPSVIEDIITDTDVVENIVKNITEARVRKIVESGKIDETLEIEVKRFIKDDWNSSDINDILIARVSEKLVLKGD